MTRPGIEPTTSRSQSGRSTTEPLPVNEMLCESSGAYAALNSGPKQQSKKIGLSRCILFYLFIYLFFFCDENFRTKRRMSCNALVFQFVFYTKKSCQMCTILSESFTAWSEHWSFHRSPSKNRHL